MVALLRPNTLLPTVLPSRKTPTARRHLRLVQPATSARPSLVGWITPSMALGATGALMFLLSIVGMRTMQGTPPAGFELPTPEAVSATEAVTIGGLSGVSSLQIGDVLVTVAPGQNMWDVARSVHPDGDVRALVVALSEQNGGSSLRVGQELLIPGHLMG